ncbi:N-acetylmuramoyl-L-alanine amidase [Dellaglioa sp. L3N]
MTYKINKTFALSGAQGDARKAKNNVIVLHDVGNMGTTGKANASYARDNWGNAYVQFFIDGDTVYQVGEPGYVAYGAFDWANENSPVQIEIDNQTDPAKFKKSYATFIALTRDMAKKYDIDLDLDTKHDYGIKTHKWVSDNKTGNHQDPYAYLAKMGISKAQLAKDLKNGVGSSAKPNKPSAPSKPNKPSVSTGIKWIAQKGTFKLNSNLPLTKDASGKGALIANIGKGQSIDYNAYGIGNGYVWIRQPRGNGYGYMATGNAANGKRKDYWGSFK